MFKSWMVSALLLGGVQATGAGDAGAMSHYHDAALGFTYEYPANLRTSPELSAMLVRSFSGGDAAKQEERRCLSLPLAAIKDGSVPGGEGTFGILLLVRVDHACRGDRAAVEDLGEDAQMMVRKGLASFGRALTEDAMRYKVDGHDAYFAQGTAPAKMLGDGKELNAGAACLLVGTNTVCWLIVDSDHKAMAGLVANRVTFDGRVGVALVDPGVVQRW